MEGSPEHGVVRGFLILSGLARLLIAADEKDGVVGSRGDRQRGQHGHHECRESQEVVVTENRDNTSGGAHLEADHDQNQQHRADGAVRDEEHDHDDRAGHSHHDQHAFVGGLIHVGGQRSRAGDVYLEALRWGGVVHDCADRCHRLVAEGAALVASQIELYISGVTVPALNTGSRQRVAPHVLNVLNVAGVCPQCAYQVVVVVVCRFAERIVALQHDHGDTVGVRFLVLLADVLSRHHRRRVMRRHRHRMISCHRLDGWHKQVHRHGQ